MIFLTVERGNVLGVVFVFVFVVASFATKAMTPLNEQDPRRYICYSDVHRSFLGRIGEDIQFRSLPVLAPKRSVYR